MAHRKPNPYDAPAHKGVSRLKPHTNSLARGFGFAVPFGILGFGIPLTIGFILQFVQTTSSSYAGSPANDLTSLFHEFLDASIGCGILFALSAVLNFSPRIRLGYVRCLLLVGLSAFAGALLSGSATLLLGLEQRTYTDDPFRWLRVLLAASIPTIYTVVHTCRRFSIRETPSPMEIDGQQCDAREVRLARGFEMEDLPSGLFRLGDH